MAPERIAGFSTDDNNVQLRLALAWAGYWRTVRERETWRFGWYQVVPTSYLEAGRVRVPYSARILDRQANLPRYLFRLSLDAMQEGLIIPWFRTPEDR